LAPLPQLLLPGIAAAVGLSVRAFGEQQKATRELTQSLQQQGIFTQSLLGFYQDLAEEKEKATGQDAEQIKSGLSLLQGYLGEQVATKELTDAVSDLAAAKGIDLVTAYDMVGKSIGTTTNALSRQGIEVDTTATRTQKMAQVIDQITTKFGGQAEAQAKGLGSLQLLSQSFDEFLKKVGERFAPMIEAVATSLSNFFRMISENQALVTLVVTLGTVAAVIAALVATVSFGALAYLKLKAAMVEVQAISTALSLATGGLSGSMGGLFSSITSAGPGAFNFVKQFGASIISSFTSIPGILRGAGTSAVSFFSSMISGAQALPGLLANMGSTFASMGGAALQAVRSLFSVNSIMTLLRTSTQLLVGATGIGLILIAVSYIAANWDAIYKRMSHVFTVFVNNITDLGGGLKDFLQGVFTLDGDKIKAGIDKIKSTIVKGFNEAVGEIPEIKPPVVEQDPSLLNAANERRKINSEYAEWERQHNEAEGQLRLLKASDGSKKLIDLKSQEVDILKQLEEKKNSDISEALEAQLTRVRDRQAEQTQLEADQRSILREQLLADNEEFNSLTEEQKARFLENAAKTEQDRVLRDKDAARAVAEEKLKNEIDANNKFIIEKQKFGETYAKISRFLNTEEVKGAASASSELVQLQQSTNSTLKGIGKAAAVADITMKTAQSAMNIYNGFATIPIIGPALGIAGAAAAVAFGAERIGEVTAANKGGVIPGGGPNLDSVFSFLTPGELVVPRQNFDEVVGSVASSRSGENGPSSGIAGAGEIVQALQAINQKLDRPYTYIEGDVLADEAFIDALIKKVSDRIEFGNATIYGVNA
jgi:hypothetical protein